MQPLHQQRREREEAKRQHRQPGDAFRPRGRQSAAQSALETEVDEKRDGERRQAPHEQHGSREASLEAEQDRPRAQLATSSTGGVAAMIMIFCQIFCDSPAAMRSMSLTASVTVGSGKLCANSTATLEVSDSISEE